MTHTPGPWKVGEHGARVVSDALDYQNQPIVFPAEDTCILTMDDREVLGCSEWMRVEDADIRLMAAAPDLLLACKMALNDRLFREWPEIATALMAAITKAGDEP